MTFLAADVLFLTDCTDYTDFLLIHLWESVESVGL